MPDAVVSNPTSIPCPSCGSPLLILHESTDATCACGFTAFAPYVTEAHYLRTGLPKWQARLAQLDDAISKGERPVQVAHASTQPESKSATADQYLVGGGSILLFAGLAAFVGIMWRFLPTVGQGAVLTSVTVALSVLSIRLAKRIQSTATALSALSVGSWAIGMGWIIDRAGIESRIVQSLILPAMLAVLTAVVFNSFGRRFSNAIWNIVGQVFVPTSIGLVLTSLTLNISESSDVTSTQLAVLALPLTIGVVFLVGNSAMIQRAFFGVARSIAIVVLLLFATGFATAAFAADDRAALVWAIHLIALTFIAWRTRGSEFIAPYTMVFAIPLLVFYFASATQMSPATYSLSALPLTLLLLALIEYPAQLQRLVPEKSRSLLVVIALLLVLNFVQEAFLISDSAYYAWAIHFVVLAGCAWRRTKLRGLVPGLVAVSVALSAGFTDLPMSVRVALPVLLCLLSLRVVPESKMPTSFLISATSGIWILLSFAATTAVEARPYAALLSALTGLVLLIQAWRTKQIQSSILGSVFLAAAVVFTNVHLDVSTLDFTTLPIALAFLLSGLIAHTIDSKQSSFLWLAPSCAVAFLPSALRSSETLDYSTRFFVTLIATLALLIFGARLRYVGMLAVGLVSVLILARNPVLHLFDAVEPWIVFTLSGLLLLVVGARFEFLRKRAGVAKEWLTGSLR